jgi:PRTRC genetic system protein E
MFKELAPLLRNRSVLLTVTHLEEDQFRVNVVPKKIADSENDALTTPLSVTGTVEEFDEQLPQTLQSFVCSHLELKNSLERAKNEMEAAAKAAQAEARAKSKPQITKKDTQAKATLPTFTADEKAEPPKTADLFGVQAEPSKTTAVTTVSRASGAVANSDEEEEILAEIAEHEEESEEDDSAD